jgi:hypothetical protein
MSVCVQLCGNTSVIVAILGAELWLGGYVIA